MANVRRNMWQEYRIFIKLLFLLLCRCWNKCWELVYCAGQDNIKLYATYEGQHRLACMAVDPVICQVNRSTYPRSFVIWSSSLRDVCLFTTNRHCPLPSEMYPFHTFPPYCLTKTNQFYLSGVIDFDKPTFTQLLHSRLCASRTWVYLWLMFITVTHSWPLTCVRHVTPAHQPGSWLPRTKPVQPHHTWCMYCAWNGRLWASSELCSKRSYRTEN
jgi:hypothetical protein